MTPAQVSMFKPSGIINFIKSGALKPNEKGIETILPSGSKLELKYKFTDGKKLTEKMHQHGFYGKYESESRISKTITKPNNAYTKIEYTYNGDSLVLKRILQTSSEGSIAQNFEGKEAKDGMVWTRGGEIIWKYEGALNKPKKSYPYSDPFDSATLKDIADYVRLTMKQNL